MWSALSVKCKMYSSPEHFFLNSLINAFSCIQKRKEMWHFSAAPTAVTLKVVTLNFVYSSKANLSFNMKSTGLKGKKIVIFLFRRSQNSFNSELWTGIQWRIKELLTQIVSTYKQKKSTNEKFYLLILLDLLFSLKSFCVTIDWLCHSFDGCNKCHVTILGFLWF